MDPISGNKEIIDHNTGKKISYSNDTIKPTFKHLTVMSYAIESKWRKLKLLARGALFRPRMVGEDELVTLLYTSGTTGRPKGVCLTHRNIASNIESARSVAGFTSEDVAVQMLPLFHTFALTVTMGVPLATGSTSVGLKRFAPDQVLDAIERHRCTFIVAIPSMYRLISAPSNVPTTCVQWPRGTAATAR